MRRSARYRIACLVVSLGMALRSGPAFAQDGPEQQLTGGSSRAWVLQRFVRPAGPGNACTAGAIYTFAVTHEVTISRCQDGQVAQSRHAWSISPGYGGGTTMTIDGIGVFLVSFQRREAGGALMRLRATGPGSSMELTLDED